MGKNSKKGEDESAQESADSRSKCQGCPVGEFLREEFKKMNEELQPLRLECKKTKDDLAAQHRELSELRVENQRLSKRLAELENSHGRFKNFFFRVFNMRFLVGFWSKSVVRSDGASDAHSGLTFPLTKIEVFERCWRVLYVDVPHAVELDRFFESLRTCRTGGDLVVVIESLANKYPLLRKNKFLRSQEGIGQLVSLVNHPDDSIMDVQSIVRRVRRILE
jgi:hypothetical protein